MRKISFNFLASMETRVQESSNNPNAINVARKEKTNAAVKKWLSLLLIIITSFSLKAQVSVSGTTAGTTPVNYTTLKLAFDAVNAGTHQGDILISITASTTETAQAVLSASGGTSSYTSVLIKPAPGTTDTISGSLSTSIIKLDGADKVMIDGSNSVGGTTKNLLIRNTFMSTAARTGGRTAANIFEASSAVIWIASISGNGATNDTIKNCIVRGSSHRTTYSAIISSASVGITSSAPTGNINNAFINNSIGYAQHVVRALAATFESGLNISGNLIDSAYSNGIVISNQQSFVISNNTLNNIATPSDTSSGTIHGIQTANSIANGFITGNKIIKVRQNSIHPTIGYSGRGITLSNNSTTGNNVVANNFIGDVSSYGLGSALTCYGISVAGVAASGVSFKIYNNSVNITTPPTITTTFTAALGVAAVTTANSMDIRNNIFSNTQGSGFYYAFYNLGAAASTFQFLDYNDYYSTYSSIINFGSGIATIAAMQAASGKDANSIISAPSYVSTTDLHLNLVAGNAALNNSATPLVTTDIDGATRSTVYPDMGADEIVYIPRISTFTPTAGCAGTSITINGADFTGTTGVSIAGANASSSTVVSTSQLTAVVAGGFSTPVTGVIAVTNASGTGSSTATFTRKAPGTYTSKSLNTASPGDEVLITGTNLSGASGVTFNGTTASFTITNSTQLIATVPVGATTGNILITDTCGNSINAGSITLVFGSPCTTPSAQATSFIESSKTSTNLSGSFSTAAGSPSGYLVVYSTSALSGVPSDQTVYTAGGSLGGGTILQVSASTNVSLTSLAGNTAYIITVFAYNGGGCSGGPLYNTTAPLVYNFTTCPSIPTSVAATVVANTSGNAINFSWATPAGGTANSLTYTLEVTTDAGYTSHIAGSPYTVSSLSQSVTNLNIASRYYYRIKANNGCSSNYVSGNTLTGCGATTILPYTQNFDGFVPAVGALANVCWTIIDNNNGNGTGDGISWTTASPVTGPTGLSSPYSMRYRYNTTNTTIAANDWAMSPGMALTGGVSYTLSFKQAVASASFSEGLLVKYGTSPTVAAMTSTALFENASLTNTAAALRTATFTVPSTGVYYFGFQCYSAANRYDLYIDDVQVEVTPPIPSNPSNITFTSIAASSATVNWADNANNELGYYVYLSTDSINYTLQATVGANVTTANIVNLNATTKYYVKVTAYNNGGESNGVVNSFTTTSCGGVYTTNTFVGTLIGNQITNWNTPSNWSAGHAPLACEDVVINSVLPITNTTYLYLNANSSIHNLTISADNTGTAIQRLFVYTQSFSLDISGDVNVSNNRSGNTGVTGDAIYLVSGPGIISINGTTNIGVTGNRVAALGAGGASLGPIYFRGDANFGPQAFLNFGTLINFTFDAPVAQTVNVTSEIISATPSTYGFGAFTVGGTNSPTVTLNGTGTSTLSNIVGDFTINNGSSLIIPTGKSLNRTTFGGNFTLAANSVLKVGGATGGFGNSNFPNNFATFNTDNTSTVEYNGAAKQDVVSLLPYGNLKINNASNVQLTGGTTVNNSLNLTSGKINTGSYTLTLGASANVSGASSSNYVYGNLAKTIGAATSSKLFEIGDTSTYTPVSVSFVGGSTNSGGVFAAKTTTGTPTGLGFLRSGISTTVYLNRSYTLTNSGVTGFSTISPTFNYADTDRTFLTANTNYKIADSLSGGGWSLATTTNPTATSTAGSGISFSSPTSGYFVIGQIDPAPAPNISTFVPTAACEGATYVVTGTDFYAITGVTIGGTNVPVFTVNSPTQITLTIPVGVATGVINVENGTGNSNSNGSLTINQQPQTTVSPSSQTICSGDAITTLVMGNSSNIPSTTYSWTRTTRAATGSVGTSGNTNPTGTLINAVTIPVLDSFTVTSFANGCTGTVAYATVTTKASPGTVNVNPTSADICQTVAQQLNSSFTAATGSSSRNSGVVTLAIPDNNVAGVNTILNVNDIPAGAVITGIDVQFDITHTFNSDLSVNLTAPNGKTINLAHQVGFDANFGGVDFYNTVISSASTNPLPETGVPTDSITGTFAASLANGVGSVAYPSNTTSWSQLYAIANGDWRLSARDYFAGDVGTIKNYRLTIYYTLSPTFSWTPQSGLYTDAGFTPYTGGSNATVFAKNVAGSYTYNARIAFNGCTVTSAPVNIDINATPIATRTNASQSICSGNTIQNIVLGTSNSISGTTFAWTRNHTAEVSGTIGNSGSGDITGTLINNTSSPITVTFTITPTGPNPSACEGASVTATVTVNPKPVATATPATQGSCSGTAISQISFGTSNGISGTSYTWTRDNTVNVTGISASGSSFISGTLTNNTAGSIDVTFTVLPTGPSSAGSCSGTSTTAVVTVSPRPTTYSVSGGGNYCAPGAGLPVNLSNSQVGINYQLMLAGSPVGSAVAGTGSALAFGNQTAVGTYTVDASNGGCSVTMSGSAVITATTTVTPTVSIAANATSVCSGTNVSFFAVATNAGTAPTYNFIVNGVSQQNSSSNVYITNTLATGSVVSCTMTSNNTCQTTATASSNEITITVSPLPTVAPPTVISGATMNCTVGAVTYLANATAGGVWSSSNTNVATVTTYGGKVLGIANGNAIINYTVTGSNGCTNSAAIIYTVAELATPAAITGTNRVCFGSTVQLSSATSGGVWSSLNNAASINASTGLLTGTNNNATVPALIRYTVSNAQGCSKFATYNVTINSNPAVPNINYAVGTSNPQYGAGAGGYCIGRTFTLVGSPTGGSWSSSAPSVASVTTPGGVVSTLALGAATITYTFTNVNGCSNRRSMGGTVVNCPGLRGTGSENSLSKMSMDFTIYPNPARGSINFNTDYFVTGGGSIVITDIYGKQVKNEPLNIGTNNIDISKLSKGFYLVSMITSEGKTTKKLVVE